jgi:hypothetical protein
MDGTPDWTEEVLFASMRSIVEPHSCCYLAGPLTTSKAKLTEGGDLSSIEIEQGNRARMREIASYLRGSLSYPVIDSSVLQVPGWVGPQYGRFFLRVMEELCFEVRFVKGWEYSAGATKEFVRAQQLTIHCFDEDGADLTLDSGIGLIEAAAREMASVGVENSRYLSRAESLRDIR